MWYIGCRGHALAGPPEPCPDPEIAAIQPELLAYHYKMAGMNDPAVDYWHKAGRHAMAHSAHSEAIAFMGEALACLNTLPDTASRYQKELHIQIDLGLAFQTAKGFAASEAKQSRV